MKHLEQGVTGKAHIKVTEDMLASRMGSGAAEVFATPSLVLLMEEAASAAVQPYLEDGEITVGSMVNIRHLAPTPLGAEVSATAVLSKIEGRKLVFNVEAFDEFEKIGEGTHERYVVDRQRFIFKAKEKSTRKN